MKPLFVPDEIASALTAGATVAVSVSGGKDSQALAARLTASGIGSYVIHMDLGRAEWPQTPGIVERIAADSGLPLVVVNRPQGDLVHQIEERAKALVGTGKPFWPSSSSRYCTSDQKRSQADKVYRRDQLVISAEGIRADESPKRGRDPVVSVRKQITAKWLRDLSPAEALAAWLEHPDRGRLALTWNAIHTWTIADVWEACGTSTEDLEHRRNLYRYDREDEALGGWPCHPAYVFGNSRLSCVLCILASSNDLVNGAHHNPALAKTYIGLERTYGSTFKNGQSLEDIVGHAELQPSLF